MTPKVSVTVLTFNHERYVGDCLQSIVDQKVDFPFEVIVGDDLSTDGTRKIIGDFAQRHPGRIVPLLHERKVGPTPNYLATQRLARGEYVAHVDGDDLMRPGKLARQAAFLDANPDCAVVAHRVDVLRGADGAVIASMPYRMPPPVADANYLVENGCFFTHSSKMFRKSADSWRPPEGSTKEIVDFFIHLKHARHGKIGFLDETLGAYRKVENSFSSAEGSYRGRIIESYFDAYAEARAMGVPGEIVDRGTAKFMVGIALNHLTAGRNGEFAKWIGDSRVNGRFYDRRHRLLYALRNWPLLVRAINSVYSRVK